MDSSGGGRSKQRHPERTEQQQPPPPRRRRRSQSDKNSPSEASRIQATGDSNSNGGSSRGAEQPRPGAPPAETTRTATNTKPSKTGAGGGVGAFGPVVGLSVVIAVSMAGLLGGRLWAVACVCAWLVALSRLRQQTAAGDGAEEAAVDDVEDSTDHKKRVVLRGLLERDRRKAVTAA